MQFIREKINAGDPAMIQQVKAGLFPRSLSQVAKIHLLRLNAWHGFRLDHLVSGTKASKKPRETQRPESLAQQNAELRRLCFELANLILQSSCAAAFHPLVQQVMEEMRPAEVSSVGPTAPALAFPSDPFAQGLF
eukprot:TRINITY_DN7496_c0_g1_i1.p1 TRINITY_DN7496_c0_g1~~TRINITY_DN7496_c0_g1_i1.p1  ORF type:complete len:135 (+),score=23.76 TRINITY_DN7496_c0_g1_i1:176-580(+)